MTIRLALTAAAIVSTGRRDFLLGRRFPSSIGAHAVPGSPARRRGSRAWRASTRLTAPGEPRELPVVMASADAQTLRAQAEQFRADGCAVLSQPFELEDLLCLIRQLLPASGPGRQHIARHQDRTACTQVAGSRRSNAHPRMSRKDRAPTSLTRPTVSP